VLGNIIILILWVLTIAATYFGLKSKTRLISVTALLIFLPLALLITYQNIPFLLSPFTSKIHGKIIDADSKKPLANINIKAGWMIESVNVGGNFDYYYNIYDTQTNREGVFQIPSALRGLSIFTSIYDRKFDGIHLAAYSLDYNYKIFKKTINTDVIIELMPIRTDKDFVENIALFRDSIRMMNVENSYEKLNDSEKKYILNSYKVFYSKYSNSKEDRVLLSDLSQMGFVHNEKEMVDILDKIIERYPNDLKANYNYAKDNIDFYRNKFYGGRK